MNGPVIIMRVVPPEAQLKIRLLKAENAALRRENAWLSLRVGGQRRLYRDMRASRDVQAALRDADARTAEAVRRNDRQLAFAAVGLAVALTCLVCSLCVSGLF